MAKTARDLTRDAAFGWHTWIWARLQAKTGKSRVFYYYFDQHPDYPADSPRAGYGSPPGLAQARSGTGIRIHHVTHSFGSLTDTASTPAASKLSISFRSAISPPAITRRPR